MNRSAIALLFLASCLVGCGPSWDVVEVSGPPSALQGIEHFTVRTDYKGTLVDGDFEADYAKELDPDDQDHWAKSKYLMDGGFLERVSKIAPNVSFEAAEGKRASTDGAELRVTYFTIQPGSWGFFIEEDSIVKARLAFFVGGEVTDAIDMECDASPSRWNPTIADRLANIGRQLGHGAAEFLNEAQGRD
jgi:hypothetical protein